MSTELCAEFWTKLFEYRSYRGGGNPGLKSRESDRFIKSYDIIYPPKNIKETKKTDKTDKKGLSIVAKAGIGIAAVVCAFALLRKGKVSQAKDLAKNIDFKSAKSVDEAVQFGKTHLGIKNYQGFEDVDVINWVNEAITNNVNKMGGKLKTPRIVSYESYAGDSLAGVTAKGDLVINKAFFANTNAAIEQKLDWLKEVVKFERDSSGICRLSAHDMLDKDSLIPVLEQFRQYKLGTMSFKEKISFYNSLSQIENTVTSILNSPLDKIKRIMQVYNCDEFTFNGVKMNFDKVSKLSLAEQRTILGEMVKATESKFSFDVAHNSAFDTIYHELGHLQDTVPRCLTTDKYNFDYSKYCDELKAWVDNRDVMQTANKVSEYASHGPGEFIAETYASLVNGKKLPEDVLALYKKLNGPPV